LAARANLIFVASSFETHRGACRRARFAPQLVTPGLVPGIHVQLHLSKKDVDGWDKPGHDENGIDFRVAGSGGR